MNIINDLPLLLNTEIRQVTVRIAIYILQLCSVDSSLRSLSRRLLGCRIGEETSRELHAATVVSECERATVDPSVAAAATRGVIFLDLFDGWCN